MKANPYPLENDLTGGLPINLDSLTDGPPGSKPFYPYSTLIRHAIKGSPNQKLLLADIYYAIESRARRIPRLRLAISFPPVPLFQNSPQRNSVRHNLTLNPSFEKVPRPLTDPGNGSYWTVNDNVDPRAGVHRIRKRKSNGAKGRTSEDDIDYHPLYDPLDDSPHIQPQLDESGGPSQGPYPPFLPYIFNLNFPMMDMRLPLSPEGPMPISPEENMDENEQVNWRMAWLNEIEHLHQVTTEQEKAGVDSAWYMMMLFRLRDALMPPIDPDAVMHVLPDMPTPQQQDETQKSCPHSSYALMPDQILSGL
ncbi:hypothetical protein B0H14DRAFT_3633412 [Mycena olivaceomarginata]|nr:hypothetical protein B0H14DRAFT_3633412 [Mycena olivaceomarginata]